MKDVDLAKNVFQIHGTLRIRAMTIIETAKLNGLDPLAYLADIFDRIHDHKIVSVV